MVLLTSCSDLTTTVPNENKASASSHSIQYAFSQEDQHPEKLLDQVIEDSQKTLDIAIFSITEKSIVSAILNAKQRGVDVRIITDEDQSEGKGQKAALEKFKNAGIPIKVDHHSGYMHLKVTIADQEVVTTGSFNYSASAVRRNDEVLVVIPDREMAKQWTRVFDSMWKDDKNFLSFN
ncbi:phospholipase D family protein [Paenibacillus sp. UY79]|nr:phospholipase D family protein [Paenibacillus farraposensis]